MSTDELKSEISAAVPGCRSDFMSNAPFARLVDAAVKAQVHFRDPHLKSIGDLLGSRIKALTAYKSEQSRSGELGLIVTFATHRPRSAIDIAAKRLAVPKFKLSHYLPQTLLAKMANCR